MISAVEYRRSIELLARECGIQLRFRDMHGRYRRAANETVLAAARAMGVNYDPSPEGIKDAAQRLRQQRLEEVVEPVIIAWNGRLRHIEITLPVPLPETIEAELRLESGDLRRLSWRGINRYVKSTNISEAFRRLNLPFDQVLPHGYHQFSLKGNLNSFSSLVVSAPSRAHGFAGETRRWGLFSPLYALRSRSDWGAGDIGHLNRLADYSAGNGGTVLATLPLLPVFLEERFDPSPYAPVSRMFWNEFYIQMDNIPELDNCPEVVKLLNSAEFKGEINKTRKADLVDYPRVSGPKKRLLSRLADDFFHRRPSPRWQQYQRFLVSNPETEDYCRFRAVSEERGLSWRQWPEKLRCGLITDADCRPELLRYYLYAQFIISTQLNGFMEKMRRQGLSVYLDLPLGAHPDGYDAWREQKLFVPGVSVGAPPDPAFPGGQDWGFPPPHPRQQRLQGYRYFRKTLRHHLQCAGILRLDHVMGMHRLFWIPSGSSPAEGAYIHYPAEEMYAVICLESRRSGAVIVGEDLGLVPAAVRKSMRRHHIYRSYVAQYEMITGDDQCLTDVPRQAVSALNTHDMHPFAAFWEETDIPQRQQLGVLPPEQASAEKQRRDSAKTALLDCLQRQGHVSQAAPSTGAVGRAITEKLAGSQSEVLLINMADLWEERRAQNIPGTVDQHPNWRRKSALSLEQINSDLEIRQFLAGINRLRNRVNYEAP